MRFEVWLVHWVLLFSFFLQEKLYQWIVRQEEQGTRVSTADITTYLQNALEYEPEETSIPLPMQEFYQHQFAPPNVNTSVAHVPSSHIAQQQHYDCNQEKLLIPPNGLSSPVRRTLQDFNLCEAESGNNNYNPNSTGEHLSYWIKSCFICRKMKNINHSIVKSQLFVVKYCLM
jgi:hypothetical protein